MKSYCGSFLSVLLACTVAHSQEEAVKIRRPITLNLEIRNLNNDERLKNYINTYESKIRKTYRLSEGDNIKVYNRIFSNVFPKIESSPTPVFVPMDVQRYLSDRFLTKDKVEKTSNYLFENSKIDLFWPGPSGFDLSMSIPKGGLSRKYTYLDSDVALNVSSSVLDYKNVSPVKTENISEEKVGYFNKVKFLKEKNSIRVTSFAFGVPYLYSVECRNVYVKEFLNCTDAEKLIKDIMSQSAYVGGGLNRPVDRSTYINYNIKNRPRKISRDFKFYSPGKLLPGTAYSKKSVGRIDYTPYAYIRYPLKEKSYLNSQVFMHGGDCFGSKTNREPASPARNENYKCKQNNIKLVYNEAHLGNFQYPWRDNFCENRGHGVGQCISGYGHQGQDIRPSNCTQASNNDVKCKPYGSEIVAVRDGVILRGRRNEATYLIVNTADEHFRVRYLHMNPNKLNEDGIVTGKVVREGEVIGKMGTYMDGLEFGTSYHLHFDLQVPTSSRGWQFVSPYMTLIYAYERMIGERGEEIRD